MMIFSFINIYSLFSFINIYFLTLNTSVLSSLYRFLHFHMRIAVIHQAHKVEASFALLQHEYPNLISSMSSELYALTLVASEKSSHKQFGKETCQVEFCMLFCRPIGSHVTAKTNPSLLGSLLFLRSF